MEQDMHKPKRRPGDRDTGNKNKRLNKFVLGNAKHRLFEFILEHSGGPLKTAALKQRVAQDLRKERVGPKHPEHKGYFNNLILFASNCIMFKKKYLAAQRPFKFKSKSDQGSRDGRTKQVRLKAVVRTEEYTDSSSLGLLGGIDIRFAAELFPDVEAEPERSRAGQVIVELKTGRKKRADEHQAMCYLMAQFGMQAFEHLGFVLYSDKDDLSKFLVKAVEPSAKYFLDVVLHRNSYVLNPKFFYELERCLDQT